MNKKYKMIESAKLIVNRGTTTLYRIEALRDFNDVKAGDLGGYIESEDNLSHDGNCWVYDNAMVCDDAMVYGNAKVYGNANVCGYAQIFGDAMVSGDARVFGSAKIFGNTKVFGDAEVFGNAKVFNNAEVYGDVCVCDNAKVFGNAEVYGDACVCDNTKVYGNAIVYGITRICCNANIFSNDDYLCISNIGSRKDCTTFYLDSNKNIMVTCGCFNDTIDKFEERVIETHKDNKYAKEYLGIIKYVKDIYFNK